MVTSPQEYLSGKRREVTLPSTLPNGEHPVFIIRKPPTKVMIRLLSLLEVSLDVNRNPELLEKDINEAMNTPQAAEKIVRFLDLLLPACVVEPKITNDPNETDGIYIDDVDMEDQLALLEAILDLAGLSKKAEEERNL